MKPKNMPLFYAGLLTGLAGSWLFTFTLYWIQQQSDPDYCCGANIGAGMVGLFSWALGLLSATLLLLSFIVGSKK